MEKLFFHIIVGILLAFVLTVIAERTSWGENMINNIFDQVYIRKEAEKLVDKSPTGDIIFIEINADQKYKYQCSPMIPREKIALSIETAYRNGAKVIYPNFFFECNRDSGDLVLKDLLKRISEENSDVQLIFPTRLINNIRPANIYDDLIENEPRFHLAISGVVSSSMYETTNRYWRSYESYEEEGKKQFIWGIPLLASVLARGNIVELASFKTEILNQANTRKVINLNSGKTIRLSTEMEDIYYQRIRFSIFPPEVLTGPGKAGNLDGFYIAEKELEYYYEWEGFKDKIVIIGGKSAYDIGWSVTPVGKMANIYLIGNAVETLIGGKQTSRAPLIMNIFFYVLIILTTALLFNYSKSILLNLVLTIFLSYLFINIIGFHFYYHSGIFINVVLYTVVLNAFEMINQAGEVGMEIRGIRRKWHKKFKKHS